LAEAVGPLDQSRREPDAGDQPPYGTEQRAAAEAGAAARPILGLDQPLQALLVRRWFVRLKENTDLGLETADAMIDHIHVERGLDELAANPLLLTAMCIIYDQGKRLPHDKYTLYDKIVDTVLHKRYAEKERVDPDPRPLGGRGLGMHTGEGLGQHARRPEATRRRRDRSAVGCVPQRRRLDRQGLRDIVRVREDLLSQSGLLVSRRRRRGELLSSVDPGVLGGGAAVRAASRPPGRGGEAVPGPGQVRWLAEHAVLPVRLPGRRIQSTRRCRVPAPRGERYRAAALEVSHAVPAAPSLEPGDRSGRRLQILAGREAAIPDDLTNFFQRCVFQRSSRRSRSRSVKRWRWHWAGWAIRGL
jgi:hypothetical protein